MKRAAAFALAFLVAAGADGASKHRDQKVVDHWQEVLIAADEAIKSKNYEQAEELAQELLDAFDERLAGGPGAKKFYAAALVRRALAAVGQGRHLDAQWDWDVALAFLPEEIVATTFDPAVTPETTPELIYEPTTEGLTEPQIIHREPPHYTAAARQAFLNGTVALELVIDRDGRVRSPTISQSLEPGLDFAALEAIRQWRFQPAVLAGRTVAIRYEMTVQFRISGPFRSSGRLIPPSSYLFPLRSGL